MDSDIYVIPFFFPSVHAVFLSPLFIYPSPLLPPTIPQGYNPWQWMQLILVNCIHIHSFSNI